MDAKVPFSTNLINVERSNVATFNEKESLIKRSEGRKKRTSKACYVMEHLIFKLSFIIEGTNEKVDKFHKPVS